MIPDIGELFLRRVYMLFPSNVCPMYLYYVLMIVLGHVYFKNTLSVVFLEKDALCYSFDTFLFYLVHFCKSILAENACV